MRQWIFFLIFSTLLGNMNAHQVQLVTHHEKTNGVLIRIVVSNVPKVDDIAGWVGQENWFYLTINKSVFAENVLETLKSSSPILEIEGIQNPESVQIGFLMENYISDFEIFHSPSNRVFLIHLWHKLDGDNIADIEKSENENSNKIFSLIDQNTHRKPFYDSFVNARENYGPEKYFVWHNNWYSTEDEVDIVEDKKIKNKTDIWEKHWSGSNLSAKKESAYGPSLPRLNNLTSSDSLKNEVIQTDKEVTTKNDIYKSSSEKKLTALKSDIQKRKKKANIKEEKEDQSKKPKRIKEKNNTRVVIKNSSQDLAAYAIEPNLSNRKTYLKIGCNLTGVNVYLDGRRVGKIPLTKRLPVSAGWHRIRIDVPGAKKFNKSGIPTPDFRDVFVTKGRTQKVTFKFLIEEDPG
jgi:hypothetical protein